MAENKKLIEAQHPEYQKRSGLWAFYRAAYKGGLEFARQAVPAYVYGSQWEAPHDYERRLKSLPAPNYSGSVVDIRAQYITSQMPGIEGADFIEQYKADLDGEGNGLEYIVRELAKLTATLGTYYVLVDKTPGENVKTRYDEMAQGIRPRMVLLDPSAVPMWQTVNGVYEWALIQQPEPDQVLSDDLKLSDDPNAARWLLWHRDFIVSMDKEGKEIPGSRGENPLKGSDGRGVVPLTRFNFADSIDGGVLGVGMLEGIATTEGALLEAWAQLQTIMSGARGQLIMPRGAVKKEPITDKATGKIVGSRYTTAPGEIIEIDEDASILPTYLAPDLSGIPALLDVIGELHYEIMRLACLTRNSASERTVVAQSGVSKAYDFKSTGMALAEQGAMLGNALEVVLGHWAQWEGADPSGISVEFPKNYDTDTADDHLSRFERLQRAGSPAKVRGEVLSLYVRKEFVGKREAEINKLAEGVVKLYNRMGEDDPKTDAESMTAAQYEGTEPDPPMTGGPAAFG